MTAWGNDTAYENIFAEPLLNFLEPGDSEALRAKIQPRRGFVLSVRGLQRGHQVLSLPVYSHMDQATVDGICAAIERIHAYAGEVRAVLGKGEN